jgi:hypothetical protein
MNVFALVGNVVWQHVLAAFLTNWKTTACGILWAIFTDGPALAAFFSGGWDHINWHDFTNAVFKIVIGIVARDFNIGAIFSSAPRAEAVKDDK